MSNWRPPSPPPPGCGLPALLTPWTMRKNANAKNSYSSNAGTNQDYLQVLASYCNSPPTRPANDPRYQQEYRGSPMSTALGPNWRSDSQQSYGSPMSIASPVQRVRESARRQPGGCSMSIDRELAGSPMSVDSWCQGLSGRNQQNDQYTQSPMSGVQYSPNYGSRGTGYQQGGGQQTTRPTSEPLRGVFSGSPRPMGTLNSGFAPPRGTPPPGSPYRSGGQYGWGGGRSNRWRRSCSHDLGRRATCRQNLWNPIHGQ